MKYSKEPVRLGRCGEENEANVYHITIFNDFVNYQIQVQDLLNMASKYER